MCEQFFYFTEFAVGSEVRLFTDAFVAGPVHLTPSVVLTGVGRAGVRSDVERKWFRCERIVTELAPESTLTPTVAFVARSIVLAEVRRANL